MVTEGASQGAKQASKDAEWLFSQNLTVYSGEWVAVFGEKVVAHGADLSKVYADGNKRAAPGKPLFYSVPTGVLSGS
jgi:hypothetical protein